MDGNFLDELVKEISQPITAAIDCTACGACCKSLMINVTEEDIKPLCGKMKLSIPEFKAAFVEESLQGRMVINTIPCHFLSNNKCTVYEERFTECREFPHLHKSNFKGRIFGTLMHYAMCPIIFNVVEILKIQTGFSEIESSDQI
ncbi:MAG: YkgJ family cysteine cluster protein [Ferruginibacter sp.]